MDHCKLYVHTCHSDTIAPDQLILLCFYQTWKVYKAILMDTSSPMVGCCMNAWMERAQMTTKTSYNVKMCRMLVQLKASVQVIVGHVMVKWAWGMICFKMVVVFYQWWRLCLSKTTWVQRGTTVTTTYHNTGRMCSSFDHCSFIPPTYWDWWWSHHK